MSSNSSKVVDRAVPVVRKPKGTDRAKVTTARLVVNGMEKSPLWGENPALQATAQSWAEASDVLDTNAKHIADLRKTLAVAMSAQLRFRRNWMDAMKHVLASAGTVTKGSVDAVHGLGLDVRTHAKRGVRLPAPDGLVAYTSKVRGEALVQWARGGARHGFLVQHATDVSDPATFSTTIPCTKTKLRLGGLVSGAITFVHVAAIDPAAPGGHSDFSDWIAVTAG